MSVGSVYRVVHVLPYDGVGGVETAARSLPSGLHGNMAIYKCFLASAGTPAEAAFEHQGKDPRPGNPANLSSALRFLRRTQPRLVVASLWRSQLILILLRFALSDAKRVVFLHASRPAHWIDAIVTFMALRVADEVWTDSQAVLDSRVPMRARHRARVVSFVVRHVKRATRAEPLPRFIFWGRLDKEKGIDRALGVFEKIWRQEPRAIFTIIGPDRGMKAALEAQCKSSGFAGAVIFAGPKSWEEIATEASSHSFFLQTSPAEGMAMAVAEAMQLGLVPVVTPVGEIPSYAADGANAVFVHDDQDAADRVLALLADRGLYDAMAEAASARWMSAPRYGESFLAACAATLEAGV